MHFPRLAAAMGQPELAEDERFSSFVARNRNVGDLERIIDAWGRTLPAAEILRILHEADVPCEPVASIGDLLENPQVRARGQIADVPHPELGSVPFPGPAMRLYATPPAIRRGAPGLGEHTAEVLAEWLGMPADDVARMRDEGMV